MREYVRVDERLLTRILAGFWAALVVLYATRSVTESWTSRFVSLGRRLPEAVLGAAMCWLMYTIVRKTRTQTAGGRLLVAAALSIPLGISFAILNSWLLYVTSPLTGETCGGKACTPAYLINFTFIDSVNFAFVFLAWGAICVGILASAEAIAAERRVGAARDEARVAQLRALHNQVNPHFLFNCLNSLGTLVDRGDATAARGMIGEMSGFLRYGLAIDPLVDVDVEDEVEMQRRYLEIERRRFAHRLNIDIRIDEQVRGARVLPLLLQPLVENAIKHGVATTSAPVLVSIEVRRLSIDRMAIVVEDDAPLNRSGAPERVGIGTRNVSERLRARFDGDASLTVGPRKGGGYRAEISMPLLRG